MLGQYVRRLLVEGDAYRARLATATEGEEVPEPSVYLLGDKADGDGPYGSDSWSVTRDELERFIERRRETKARPGYDLTLRPPKSVSILWALVEPEQRAAIRDAHREAVDEVVHYYESQAVFVRPAGFCQSKIDAELRLSSSRSRRRVHLRAPEYRCFGP